MVYPSFTIKTKTIQHTILEISTKKNSLRNLARFYGGLFELEILEISTIVFFVENYYLNLNFFQALQSALLKSETKSSQKRCKSTKNCLTVDIARDRSKTLKKKKKTRKLFTSTFLYRKIYILIENIFGKTLFILLHLHYRFFHMGGSWKCSNTNVHTHIHWFCRCHTSIQNT